MKKLITKGRDDFRLDKPTGRCIKTVGATEHIMRFYTPKECEEWCRFMQVPLDDKQRPVRESAHRHRLRCAFPPSFSQLLWFSRTIESALQPRQTCLLWVTGFGIFPSNENQHLYYRLRQSYGDVRLLHERRVISASDYERPEVVTLVHLAFCLAGTFI